MMADKQIEKPLVKRPKTLAAANGAITGGGAKPCTTEANRRHEFGKFLDRVEKEEKQTNKL
jgi:hypothetical protein